MAKNKKKTLVDPHSAREAEKYAQPIHSREFLLDFLNKRGVPMVLDDLASELEMGTPDQHEALRRRLGAMCRDGQLVCNRRGAYLPTLKADLIRGRVIGHRDGYGFVNPDHGGDDLFLNARQMAQVFPGDMVLVRVDSVDNRGRREAAIVEVLERKTTTLVGRLFKEGGVSFITPENTRITQDVLVSAEDCGAAKHGQYVMVEITRPPSFRTKAMGRVTEVLGDYLAPGMEIDVAIRSHDIPHVWSADVEREASRLPTEVRKSDKVGRLDLRSLPLVTIDGEDARDFDDAVYCEVIPRVGWRLVVAIADVAHYVRPQTALDVEAHQRGNSVYFPSHVVPMLPERLSNGLCSLNPGVDRLCMVCDMRISKSGKITDFQFCEAIMHSHARLTYTQVGAMLQTPDSEQGQRLRERHASLVPHLESAYALFHALKSVREQRGAIDFDTVETKVEFSEDRKIERIVPVIRNDAHRLIEEFMLAANVCTASLLRRSKLPVLYRVHDGPGGDKLSNLHRFLGELSLQLGGGDDPAPLDYQALLSSISERPDKNVIQTVMLRSLSQAVYSPEEKGHFGLAYDEYTHFTSPIRRYPDLLIHRAIKALIHRKAKVKGVLQSEQLDERLEKYPYSVEQMVHLGEQCSMTERRADDATRDVMAWLKCEYLQQHLGAEFDGVISAVTSFGLFVELQEVYTEGLVHVSSLSNDFYRYEQVHHRLIGERSGQSYRLGDSVRVQVTRVSLEDRRIDLELLEMAGGRRRKAADRAAGDGRPSGSRSGKGGGGKKGAPNAAKEKLMREVSEAAKAKKGKRGSAKSGSAKVGAPNGAAKKRRSPRKKTSKG